MTGRPLELVRLCGINLVVSLFATNPALAQTWDGGGADNNWTNGLNWVGDVAPANNGTANIIMAGTVDPFAFVDVAQDILSLTFDNTAAGDSQVSGPGPLTIRSGGVTNNDNQFQFTSVPIVLQAAQTWNTALGPIRHLAASTVTTSGFALTIDGGFDTLIDGVISGSGSLTKNGTGALYFGGANTFTGATIINAGTLNAQSNDVIPDLSPGVFLSPGAAFNLNGFSDTLRALGGSGGTVSLLTTSSLTVGAGDAHSAFPGVISGGMSATLRKIGGGQFNFTGTDPFPFTGTYRVSGGTMSSGLNERLNNAADLLVDGGGFDLSGGATETMDVVTMTSGSISGGFPAVLIGSVYNLESGSIDIRLGGSASLNKNTAGTVQLFYANGLTYTGPTNVNAGTLTIENANILPDASVVTVNLGATLRFNNSDTIGVLTGTGNVVLPNQLIPAKLTVGAGNVSSTFGGVMSNTIGFGASLVKIGTGTFTLSGANTYLGELTINAGTVASGANNVLPDISYVSVNPGGTFNLNGFSDTVAGLFNNGNVTLGSGTLTVGLFSFSGSSFGGVISGSGNLTKAGTQTFSLVSNSGSNTYTGTTTVNEGVLNLVATTSEVLDNSSDLVVNGGTVNMGSGNETVDVVTLVSGSILGTGTLTANSFTVESGSVNAGLSGVGGLAKNTAGTVTLSGNNTYTGTTVINAGVLALGAGNVLPDSGSVIVNVGTLDVAGFSDTIGFLSGPATGSVVLGSGTLTVGAGDLSGVISGTGNITKVGSGTLSVAGANAYTGTTTITGGLVQLGNNERLADASDLIVAGGTFDLQSFNETLDVVTLSSGAIIGTGTLLANVFNVQTGTISANLAGAAALTKTTAGTVTLSGTNTYTGGTYLSAGVLVVASPNGIPSGGSLTFDGGSVRTTATTTISGPVTLVGGGTIDTVVTTTLSGSISGNGGLTKEGLGTLRIGSPGPQLASLTVNTGDLELPVGGTLIVTGGMILGSDGLLSLDGGLISANSFANGGEIELLAGARLNGPIANSGVIAGEGRVSGALTNNPTGEVLVTDGESFQFASTASSSNAGVLDVLDAELEFDGELTNLASTGLIFARDALLRFNGGLINAGSVALSFGISDIFGDIENQNGASIVISGGSDATLVDDVVNDGMIRVSQGSAAVFFGGVSGGGSFPGTGTVFLEGDLRPGASPARIEFGGDLVLGSGASLTLEIGGTTPGDEYDQIVVAGEASLDGTLRVLLIDGFIPVADQSFEIMSYGSKTGAFAVVELPSVVGLCIDLVIGGTSMTVLAESAIAFGDANGDCAVDLTDYRSFDDCVSGPGGGAGSCERFDFAPDADVDLADFAAFQRTFTGAH